MSVIQPRSLVLLLILAAMGTSVPLRAQSLADIAKKEEERRKALPAPAKIYTNKDLTAVPGPPGSPSGSAGAPAPADGTKAAPDVEKAVKDLESKEKGAPKDQAYWSGRRKALQDRLDREQTFLEAIQTRINSLSADVVNRDDPAQRAVLEKERTKALAELARLQQDMTNDKKAMADFEEEARRAGVPAGWLR
jgi:chromosome segregation ATPase